MANKNAMLFYIMAEVINIEPTVKVCYDLPTTKDTTVFGPVFWNTFHDLANRIPCEPCKIESESFLRFWHDLKNKDLGKPIYDQKNFDYWIEKIAKRSKQTKVLFSVLSVIIIVLIISLIIKSK